MTAAGKGETDGLPARQRNWVMACVMLGIVLAGLDSAIANIALPTIARDLHTSESAVVWVVNCYQLAVAVSLLPAATLGEIFGVKRVYGLGLILFTAASLGCALSPSLGALVAARVVQGIGGACMAGLAPALVRQAYPRAILARGFAVVALGVAISAAIGPTIASLILAVADWPWLFLVNVPIGLIGIPIYFRVAPPGQPRPRRFDVVGAVLSAAALGLLVVGVDTLGVDRDTAVGEIVAGFAGFALLVLQQRRSSLPLLPLDLLRIPLFSLSILTSICSYSAQILAYLSLPFLFQTQMHQTQVATGLLMTPWPLLVAFAAPVAGRMMARYPAGILGSAGLAVLAVGLVLLAVMPPAAADWNIIWRMGLCGIGFGFYQTPNNTTLMTAGPANRSGAAGGMIGVARTMGWSFGSALVAVLFALRGADATELCLWAGAGFAVVGGMASLARLSAARVA